MKKYAALIILILMLLLSACGETSGSLSHVDEGSRIVTDAIGRQVEIPEKVERIACLYAFAGHVTVLLGEEEKIVAVVEGLKRDKLLTSFFPSILEKDVPFTDGTINVEELARLDPDVVFIRRSTIENQAEMSKLEAFDIPAIVIDSNTIAEQRKSAQVIAEVCGGQAKNKAEIYDDIYQRAIDTAESKAYRIDPEEKVSVYHSVNEATRTDMSGTLSAEWTALVGVENVSADKELSAFEGKMYAGLEQIYTWDPEIIICNEPGVRDYMLNDEKWSELAAVTQKRVYQMPIAISRWGHPGSMETPLAIYWLGKLAYPELYSDIDLEKETRDFYKAFFNYELDDSEIASILSGEGMRLLKTQPQ